MRIRISAIGRLKRGPEYEIAADYVGRATSAGRMVGLSSVDIVDRSESKAAAAARRMQEEAAALQDACLPGGHRIALDERGDLVSSRDFADLVRRHLGGGTSGLTFAIGGPDGLDPAFKAAASRLLSLGPMTWPHRLARAMLAEQIYRAVTIMVNHPYHRS